MTEELFEAFERFLDEKIAYALADHDCGQYIPNRAGVNNTRDILWRLLQKGVDDGK